MQIANTERPNNDWLSAPSVCPGVCICGCALAQLGGVFTVSSARTGVNNKQTNPPSLPTTPTHACTNSPDIAMETPPPRKTYYLSITAASEGLVPRSPVGSD